MKVTDRYVFFYGGQFSQWYKSEFEIDEMTFYTAEQFMMYKKALTFGDVEIAKLIMDTRDPKKQKYLGRKVRGYDDALWMAVAYDVVFEGNYAKFSQDAALYTLLESTRGKLLVEASPFDKRWGIGMAEDENGVDDPANWKGENLLGKAITEVRIELFGS